MKKEEFFAFLDKSFENALRPEDVYIDLYNMSDSWIREYKEKYFHEYVRCPKCQRLIKFNEFTTEIIEEEEGLHFEGDTVIYDVKKQVIRCPKCHEAASETLLERKLKEGV